MMELTDGLYHLVFKGFAAAKKCTNEGRALMQLDFRQFVIQVLRKAKAVTRIEEGPGPKSQTGKVNFLSLFKMFCIKM